MKLTLILLFGTFISYLGVGSYQAWSMSLCTSTTGSCIWEENTKSCKYLGTNRACYVRGDGICKQVFTSNGGLHFIAGLDSTGNWPSFVGNPPPGVGLIDCGTLP